MKSKIEYLDWLIIIIAILLIIVPFIFSYASDQKILMPTAGISLLSQLIENKKIKYTIATICLLVIFVYLIYNINC